MIAVGSRRFAASLLALLLAGCGAPVSPQPASSTQPGATSQPPPTLARQEQSPTAVVAWVLDDRGPFFDLQVDAISVAGSARHMGTIRNIHPAGWAKAAPRLDSPILVNTAGRVVVGVGRGTEDDPANERTLIFDLNAPAQPPVEVAGVASREGWGPTGSLAIYERGARATVRVVDPATGAEHTVRVPAGGDALPYWLADGSGWLADLFARPDELTTAAILLPTGAFARGHGVAYMATGLERPFGAADNRLSLAESDVPIGSERSVVEMRPGGPLTGVVWANSSAAAGTPLFGDFAWDAAGTGVWVVWFVADRSRTWLSHLVEPGKDAPLVELPPQTSVDIAGLSAGDGWIVVSSQDLHRLLVVDTRTRAVTTLARSAGGDAPDPIFAGWASVPSG